MSRRRTFTQAVDGMRCLPALLHWASSRLQVCWLDGKGYAAAEGDRVGLLAVGAIAELHSTQNSLANFNTLFKDKKDWLFGFLSYDLKNELECLKSNNQDSFKFPHLHFFCPEKCPDINLKIFTILN